jgi:hypothetical protein
MARTSASIAEVTVLAEPIHCPCQPADVTGAVDGTTPAAAAKAQTTATAPTDRPVQTRIIARISHP